MHINRAVLYVNGDDRYHLSIPKAGAEAGECKTFSAMNFYADHFMIHPNTFYHLHRSQQLFQQYAVDVYAKTELERLAYLRRNQKETQI